MSVATAPGKVILLGEHAVVYGRPALAVPVSSVRARAEVSALSEDEPSVIHALDLGRAISVDQAVLVPNDGLVLAYQGALHAVQKRPENVHLSLRVHSRIPVARGMGSGAAVAAAIIKAVAAHFGVTLAPAELSRLVFHSEQVYHGNPSGIDNSVVAYEAPVFFQRGNPVVVLRPHTPLVLLIGDTGIPSSTRDAVSAVRWAYEAETDRYESLFSRIGACVQAGRAALAGGDHSALGEAMRANQGYLRELAVSHESLEALISAAENAGALGAKLAGAGRGGCMIALATADQRKAVSGALWAAGAVRVMGTVVR